MVTHESREPGEDIMENRTKDEKKQFRKDLLIRWTDGLSPTEQRISIFSHIRDIPYAIIPEWRESDDIIRMMISENKGWCGPKHHLLLWMFEQLGISIQFTMIPFRWQDQPVKYPDELRACFPYLSPSHHLCCLGYLDNSWKMIDATWDPPLEQVGFPINDPWDGYSATIPAVIRWDENTRTEITPLLRASLQNCDFTRQLNIWFEEVRHTKPPHEQKP